MATTYRRTRSSPAPSKCNWPLVVGSVLVVSFIVSSIVVLTFYSQELKQSFAVADQRFSERIRHLSSSDQSADQQHSPSIVMQAEQEGMKQAASEKPKLPSFTQHQPEAVAPQKAAAAAIPFVPASAPVVAALQSRAATASGVSKVIWKKHTGKSCQNYVEHYAMERELEDAKKACLANDDCSSVVCPTGQTRSCTLRAVANLVDYAPEDCYEQLEVNPEGKVVSLRVHPAYNGLLKEYPFQQVSTQSGRQVNVILVRSQPNGYQQQLYHRYEKEILFLGISSMNDYPLKEVGSTDTNDYVGMFPGFLHMMREPEKAFPPHVKTILMSQSDFSLPNVPPRDYSVPKKYDFTYSASDCDVESDGHGWCGWSKNWTFVREALGLMCGELNLTGVLVATKNKANTKAYSIPDSCKGKMTQTTYLPNQQEFFNYVKQSRFVFLPQIHDASPRVSTQALAHDVPILMNWYIKGGWKYVNEKTGEFFHDMSDFKQSLLKILKGAETPYHYEPQKWVRENYGDVNSGKRLLKFIQDNFGDRVKLPKNTQYLQI